MRIEGVIFDLGHTLMTLNGTWQEMDEQGAAALAAFLDGAPAPWPGAGHLPGALFAQAFLARREEGYTRARETQREVTAEETMRWVLARSGLPDPPSVLVQGACDAFFAHEEASWAAYAEALPVLRALAARGLHLGLFSNATSEPLIQRLVDRFGFRPYFEPALTSAGTGIRKPDPAAFAPILEAWGLPAAAVVMVGDSLDQDILGAQRAGMHSIWIASRDDARQEGKTPEERLLSGTIRPEWAIAGLDELPSCLEQM